MSWAKIVIIGKANVGKSTLFNKVLMKKVAGVTPVPGTTANVIVGERDINGTKVFFTDTPGFIKPRDKRDESIVSSSMANILDADIIYFVLDAHTGVTIEDLGIMEKLSIYKDRVPIFIIINKIDGVPKEKLLPFIKEISETFNWTEIIPISAKKGTNIEELLKTTAKYLPEKKEDPPDYLDKAQKDELPVIQDIIREKLLLFLRKDAAKKARVEIEEIEHKETVVYIRAFIITEKSSIKAMVIGKRGNTIKQIGIKSRLDLEKLFNKKVFLELKAINEKHH